MFRRDLTQFWQIESSGTTAVNNKENNFLAQYWLTCISRQSDGSYCAKLQWKTTHPPLPSNREIRLKRTRSLVRHLSQSLQLLQTYDSIIRNQGILEKVHDSSDRSNKTHYIPHHCVQKESTTILACIVYDCSCHQSRSHPSFNDCLLTGPHFLNDLCSMLLLFRTH